MSLRSGKQYKPSSQNGSVEKQQEATQGADALGKSVSHMLQNSQVELPQLVHQQ